MAVEFLLSAVLGYLLGSIPSAYLLVRWKSHTDIRRTGSGNVGALNSYLVTRSRLVGAAVLFLDLLKGFLSVAFAELLLDGGFSVNATAGVASVLGHNFSVWLGLKGGRGLATAAGVCLALAWAIVPAWMLLWGAGFLMTRDVNVGNAIATALLVLGALAVPSDLLRWAVTDEIPAIEVRLLFGLMFVAVLVKHIAPVRQYFQGRNRTGGPERAQAEAQEEDS